ncbi:MAG: dynamin family protein [Cyanobacteria bacterium P01_A01_bin.83]
MAESINQPSTLNLQDYVGELLELASSESLPEDNINTVRTSCKQAVSHTFEIAFAGLRSAGKSTTINALLERELLYSQASHATGTVCYIRSVDSLDTKEKITITFVNQSQLQAEVDQLCIASGISNTGDITQPEVRSNLNKELRLKNIDQDIPDKTSQSIKLLQRLLEAYDKYQSYITVENTVLSLELNEKTLEQAAEYAAWEKEKGEVGGGSVVERIDYYCKNSLLDSGNILIDLPGIDAPIKRDRDLTENRLKDEKTGAVVFMPSSAYEGALSQEEIEINSLIKANPGIRSRVFFVFNRVDETLSDAQKRNKFAQSLQRDFVFLSEDSEDETKRIYSTSALLGFYSSVIKKYIDENGIEAINIPSAIEHGIKIGNSKIPKKYLDSLVYFLRYKQKLNLTTASDPTNSDVLAKEIKEIINKHSSSFEDVVAASGIPRLQQSIRDYVNLKKRPQLYLQLNEDLQSLCRQLREKYKKQWIYLNNSPQTTEELKADAKKKIDDDLKNISKDFEKHINQVKRDFSTSTEVWEDLKKEFEALKENTTQFLKTLVDSSDFSLDKLYKKAVNNRIDNDSIAPIVSIFVEPFYSLSSEFQSFFTKESSKITRKIFNILISQIQKQDYYNTLENLLEEEPSFLLNEVDKEGMIFVRIIEDVAKRICQEYIRESANFYDQHHDAESESSDSSVTLSFIEILGEILKSIKDKFGEPAPNKNIENSIRDLFRVQFSTDEQELENLFSRFVFQIKVSFGERLEQIRLDLKDKIPDQFNLAVQRSNQRLEIEAQSKLDFYESQKEKLQTEIKQYNRIVDSINNHQDWKSLKLRSLSTCEIDI